MTGGLTDLTPPGPPFPAQCAGIFDLKEKGGERPPDPTLEKLQR